MSMHSIGNISVRHGHHAKFSPLIKEKTKRSDFPRTFHEHVFMEKREKEREIQDALGLKDTPKLSFWQKVIASLKGAWYFLFSRKAKKRVVVKRCRKENPHRTRHLPQKKAPISVEKAVPSKLTEATLKKHEEVTTLFVPVRRPSAVSTVTLSDWGWKAFKSVKSIRNSTKCQKGSGLRKMKSFQPRSKNMYKPMADF